MSYGLTDWNHQTIHFYNPKLLASASLDRMTFLKSATRIIFGASDVEVIDSSGKVLLEVRDDTISKAPDGELHFFSDESSDEVTSNEHRGIFDIREAVFEMSFPNGVEASIWSDGYLISLATEKDGSLVCNTINGGSGFCANENGDVNIVMQKNDGDAYAAIKCSANLNSGETLTLSINDIENIAVNSSNPDAIVNIVLEISGEAPVDCGEFKVGDIVYINAENQSVVTAIDYTLILNANGGAVLPPTVTQATGTTYTLPIPTRDGFIFTSWTLSGGGSLSGNVYTFGTSNGTVTAQWTVNTTNTYTVTVNSGAGGGSYAANTTVSIMANAAPSGKVFDKWTTSDGVSFANANATTTTFTMPAKNVSVTATYKDAKGIFGTNAKWYGAWWHYLLFFFCFGFIWMWF